MRRRWLQVMQSVYSACSSLPWPSIYPYLHGQPMVSHGRIPVLCTTMVFHATPVICAWFTRWHHGIVGAILDDFSPAGLRVKGGGVMVNCPRRYKASYLNKKQHRCFMLSSQAAGRASS